MGLAQHSTVSRNSNKILLKEIGGDLATTLIALQNTVLSHEDPSDILLKGINKDLAATLIPQTKNKIKTIPST